MDRAKEFVDNFTKAIDMMYDNQQNGLSIGIIMYARDINNRSDKQPDGSISTQFMYSGTKYDKYAIKQYIIEFLDNNNE